MINIYQHAVGDGGQCCVARKEKISNRRTMTPTKREKRVQRLGKKPEGGSTLKTKKEMSQDREKSEEIKLNN